MQQNVKAPSDEGAGKLPHIGNLTEGEKYKKGLAATFCSKLFAM